MKARNNGSASAIRALNNTPVLKQAVRFMPLVMLPVLLSCGKFEVAPNQCIALGNEVKMIQPDHVIFCFFENKDYLHIIGNRDAPYINQLRAQGVLFTNCHALTHPSYPNYIHFFCGTNNGVTTSDCINQSDWTLPNLYTALASAGKTFAWYSEDLPATGSTICEEGYYRERHNPTTLFANVPPTANKRFADLPTDYSKLENVVCITPNMIHNMHDGTLKQADDWLKGLAPLVEWAKTHNSVFVVYYDENEDMLLNRIPVIAVGAHVKVNCQVSTYYDHHSWTRTACSLFGAPVDWTRSITVRDDVTGCWQ